MKNLKEKKGISLIILIITIIVMIILAAAIILSISNSGIVDKANKAKTDSDTANLKEYVNILEAEWEMMTKKEQKDTEKSRIEYINDKLKKKGYTRRLNEDGILLAENTIKALDNGLKVGDKVEGYTIVETTKSTSGAENTAPSGTEVDGIAQNVTSKNFTTWKYIGISEDGELEIVPDLESDGPELQLSGKGGYLKGPEELDTICDKLYSVEGRGKARSINLDDIIEILGYTGPTYGYLRADVYDYMPSNEELKMKDLKKLFPKDFKYFETPDGKLIDNYSANACVFTFGDTDKFSYPSRTDLVFLTEVKDSQKLYCLYWVATRCAAFYQDDYCALFSVFAVRWPRLFCSASTFRSTGKSSSLTYSIRPVVSIDSGVSVSYSDGTLTLLK